MPERECARTAVTAPGCRPDRRPGPVHRRRPSGSSPSGGALSTVCGHPVPRAPRPVEASGAGERARPATRSCSPRVRQCAPPTGRGAPVPPPPRLRGDRSTPTTRPTLAEDFRRPSPRRPLTANRCHKRDQTDRNRQHRSGGLPVMPHRTGPRTEASPGARQDGSGERGGARPLTRSAAHRVRRLEEFRGREADVESRASGSRATGGPRGASPQGPFRRDRRGAGEVPERGRRGPG